MRKLATIRNIDAIRLIPGADAIECAVVGGWTVVVKKGEFSPGDAAVYCEIDSWIPHALAPFLSKGQEPKVFDGVLGERLRTVKLRGQLSQGLLLRYQDYPQVFDEFHKTRLASDEPIDVSELLGIVKWEAPIPAQLAGEVKGAFPGWIRKTDQERVQNLTAEFAQWQADGVAWEVTEKLDGSSMTVYLRDGEFGVCSRNLELRDTESNSLWRAARDQDLETRLRTLGRNLALQGELIGEGVQGNPYRIRPGQVFKLFDIYDIDTGSYLNSAERRQLCWDLDIDHVPVLYNWVMNTEDSVESVITSADGASELREDAVREGLVFKRLDNPNISFKAISNQFLLGGGN
jgi:RNA ligase (TIGR02306 family)